MDVFIAETCIVLKSTIYLSEIVGYGQSRVDFFCDRMCGIFRYWSESIIVCSSNQQNYSSKFHAITLEKTNLSVYFSGIRHLHIQ